MPDPYHEEACARWKAEEGMPQVLLWIEDYQTWRTGGLKTRGGLQDQPARWVQAMRSLASLDDPEWARARRKKLGQE